MNKNFKKLIKKQYLSVFLIYLLSERCVVGGRTTLSKLLSLTTHQIRYAIKFWKDLNVIETKRISLNQTEIKISPTLSANALSDIFTNTKEDKKIKKKKIANGFRQAIDPEFKGVIKETLKEIKEIFEYWNNNGFKKHRVMTQKIKSAIKSKLRNYKLEEIKKAIQNYYDIVKDESYIWTYKDWTLDQFLQRAGGFNRFVDDANPFETLPKGMKSTKIDDDVWKGIE